MSVTISELLEQYTTIASDIDTIVSLHKDIFSKTEDVQLSAEVRQMVSVIKSYTPAKALLELKKANDALAEAVPGAKERLQSKYATDAKAKAIIESIASYQSLLKDKAASMESNPEQFIQDIIHAVKVMNVQFSDDFTDEDAVNQAQHRCTDFLFTAVNVISSLNNEKLLKVFAIITDANKKLDAFKEKLKKYKETIAMASAVIAAIIDVLAAAAKILPFLAI
jgi:hypothetical protein